MIPNYGEKTKLSYMDKDSSIVYLKTQEISVDIENDVETRFYTSIYELETPLPKQENKKLIGLMKDELYLKIMTEFATRRPKAYSYLTDDNDENKKSEGTKNSGKDFKHFIDATKRENKANQLPKIKVDVNSFRLNHKRET